MAKRPFAAFLAALLVLSLASCGREDGQTDTTPTAATVQIGFLLPGEETDPYDQNQILGLRTACDNLGIDYDTQVQVRTNVTQDKGAEEDLQALLDGGCQILFSAVSGLDVPLVEAARREPTLPFCQAGGLSGDTVPPDNLHTHYARVYEAWYLAGIAAGLQTQTNLLGYVAAFAEPAAISAFTAYYLGAKQANEAVTMVVRYTNSWSDDQQEAQLAQGLIDLGCDVLAYRTNTTATAQAAQDNGVSVVGYEQDLSQDFPDAALLSVRIDWSVYYTYALTCLLEGSEIAADWCGSYDQGACALTALSDHAPQGAQAAIQEAAEGLADGSVQVFAGPLYGVAEDGETLALRQGESYEENQTGSSPTFRYLVDGITVLS